MYVVRATQIAYTVSGERTKLAAKQREVSMHLEHLRKDGDKLRGRLGVKDEMELAQAAELASLRSR